MADLSQIQVGSTTYDLKDSTARGDISTLSTTVAGKADSAHEHSASDITSGTLPVGRGGTGQTTLQALRNAAGLGNTTGAVPVANGGTGATTAADARTNLGVPPTSHASTATTYGVGTASNYGHVKLSDTYSGTASTSAKAANSIGASQWALQTAYNTLNGKITDISNKLSGAVIIKKWKEYAVTANNLAAGGQLNVNVTIDAVTSGCYRKFCMKNTGWGSVGGMSVSGNTVTVSVLNPSSGTHNISATLIVWDCVG